MKTPAFTLLINSSDGFEDCWMPFFTLLKRYWPEINAPILLNTEKKTWNFAGLNIICTQAQKNNYNKLTWSECLLEALSQVETDLVLYMQEDYFIEKPVCNDQIELLIELMYQNTNIKHIGLTHFGSCPPFEPYQENERLWKISKRSRYRLSTQAGLWKINTLRSLVRSWENGWMFEIFGSIRSSRKNELFLTINREIDKPLIWYQHTGIIKGQWSSFVPSLFLKEQIDIDFDKRGFYNNTRSSLSRRVELLKKLISNPIYLIKSIASLN